MIRCIQDYEEHAVDLRKAIREGDAARRLSDDDLHADKTANAVILMVKQKWIYDEYKLDPYTFNGQYDLSWKKTLGK